MTHWVRESASSIKVSALLNDFREVVGTFYRQLSNVNIGSSSTSLRGLWSPEYNLVSELGDSRSLDPQTPAETSLREQDVCRYRAERWSHFFIHYVVLKDLLVKRAGRRIGSGHASCTLFSRVVCVAGGQGRRREN